MKWGKLLPPSLAPGDAVGVWAPASAPAWGEVERGVRVLRDAGFEVALAANLGRKTGYLAGSDEERLSGLEELVASGCRALWAARGGYGVMRLLPSMPWDLLASWGGFLIGYSDLTALHAAALSRLPFATFHGPMVTALGRSREATERVLAALTGRVPRELFRFGRGRILRPGKAFGPLVGGNLSLLASLVGTPYEPPWEGVVLALEDVGEPGYRLDRMLTHLALAGRLEKVAGVVVGALARCGRGEPGFRESFFRRLLEVVPERCPVVVGLPFGHVRRNLAFPVGVAVVLDTQKGMLDMEDPGA
ncbi:MAG: S66 peptidase family protein [Thermoanaerobaculum sp.]